MSSFPSPASSRNVAVVRRPSPAMLAGIAQVAAQMARAEGNADAIEQQALLRFLREHDLLRQFWRQTCLEAYHTALAQDEAAQDEAAHDEAAQDEVAPDRDVGTMAAPLLASAAASI